MTEGVAEELVATKPIESKAMDKWSDEDNLSRAKVINKVEGMVKDPPQT